MILKNHNEKEFGLVVSQYYWQSENKLKSQQANAACP